MPRIAINDLNQTNSQLTDISDLDVKTIIGGQETYIIIVHHGDHYHVYVVVKK